MKPFKLQWLLAVQVLIVLCSLDSSVRSVEASSSYQLLEGPTPVLLSEHYDFESAPPGSLFQGENNPTESHLFQKERVDLLETLRTYRPQSRFLGANSKTNEESEAAKGGKKTPKGAPPAPKNSRRMQRPPPPSPPPKISSYSTPPSPRKHLR